VSAKRSAIISVEDIGNSLAGSGRGSSSSRTGTCGGVVTMNLLGVKENPPHQILFSLQH